MIPHLPVAVKAALACKRMDGVYYKLILGVPKQVTLSNRKKLDRDDYFTWLWKQLIPFGLQGIHEGTLLSEEASQQGLETESWMIDSAEAPRERDWIKGQDQIRAELFFSTHEDALGAKKKIELQGAHLTSPHSIQLLGIEKHPIEDWDAQWKASFLGSPAGVKIPPHWRILPPWPLPGQTILPHEKVLKINPGAGFGTGTHETTQLCLQAISENWPNSLAQPRILDFGSGSGILSIGAALLGGQVDAVEIDPLANDNARENAVINGVENQIHIQANLSSCLSTPIYDLVIANILKPVLLEFATELTQRLAPQGKLILSGLIEKDVQEIQNCYSNLLATRKPLIRALQEWRAIIF